MSYRNAPDDQRLMPDTCAHTTSFCGAGIECQAGPEPHEQHTAVIPAKIRRTMLGLLDEVDSSATITWVDSRPAATVGDVRATIREVREGARS